MDDDVNDVEGIDRDDVVDALTDPENSEGPDLLTLYYEQLNGDEVTSEKRIANAKKCATMLLDAKRYEDVVAWLDLVATKLSDTEGPDSEAYMAFAESDDLEEIKLKATDKMFDVEEEEDYDEDEDK